MRLTQQGVEAVVEARAEAEAEARGVARWDGDGAIPAIPLAWLGRLVLDVLVGRLLEGLAEAVGNRLQIEGVALEVAEPASAMTTARELAYADAVARATHIAGLAGAGLGPVVSMAEGDGGLSGRGAALGAAVKHTVGFAPGDSVINVALQVVWQLEL